MSAQTHGTIADQVEDFNVGFNDTVGPDLAAIFAREQEDLRTKGVPAGVIEEGDVLPAAELFRPEGDTVTLKTLRDGAAAVLVFYRGAWCPYCNIALKHYQLTLAPALTERGVKLIAVSPQTPDGSAAAVASAGLGFTVVSDPANTLAGALGIITEPSEEAQLAHSSLGFAVKDSNADHTPAIPFPTIVVADAQGVVRFVDIHVAYTTRTETDVILRAVDAL